MLPEHFDLMQRDYTCTLHKALSIPTSTNTIVMSDDYFAIDLNNAYPKDRANARLYRYHIHNGDIGEGYDCIGSVDLLNFGEKQRLWQVQIKADRYDTESSNSIIIGIYPDRNTAIRELWHHRHHF